MAQNVAKCCWCLSARVVGLFVMGYWLPIESALAMNSPPSDVWRPTSADLRFLERNLVLPVDALALDKYTRYYAGSIRDGRRIIRGVLVSGTSRVVIMSSLSDLPVILDGGCQIVNVEYDIGRRQLVRAACNGPHKLPPAPVPPSNNRMDRDGEG
jgi:hypothetical protein